MAFASVVSASTSTASFRAADPTITQTFFSHFNCRNLSEDVSVLAKNYSEECSGTEWWLLAVFSAFGILIISIGFPVGMFVWCVPTAGRSLVAR